MYCLCCWLAFDLLHSCLFNVCAFVLLSLSEPPAAAAAAAAGAISGAGSGSSGEGGGGLDVGDDIDNDNDDHYENMAYSPIEALHALT